MKKWNKVLALILALAVMVSNLPVTAYAAMSSGPINPMAQQTGMRLRQTGFDKDTGILTMSLEVSTAILGNSYPDPETNGRFTNYEGRFVDELYFAFQVDTDSVMPVTADTYTAINAGYGAIGFVGLSDTAIAATGGNHEVWKNFTNQTYGMGRRFGDGFNASMLASSSSSDDIFMEDYSGYFTSANRSGDDANLMDCYLHLKWKDGYSDFTQATDSEGNSLNDGYVKAIDLYFQVYSGNVDDDDNREAANSESSLFCSSIRVPSGTSTDGTTYIDELTVDDLTTLRDQFKVYKSEYDDNQQYLSTGVAGFVDSAKDENGIAEDSKEYYGHGLEPRETKWRGTSNTSAAATAMDNNPTAQYSNMTAEYIVLGFEASLTNTYCNDETYNGTADFWNPESKAEIPQYQVPYNEDMDYLTDYEENNHIWKPQAKYLSTSPATETYVDLKYSLSSNVASSSLTKPEYADKDEFLKDITWNFALLESDDANPTLLDSFYPDKLRVDNSTARTVTLNGDGLTHTYEVKEATINDNSSAYNGCKVQTVQETTAGLENIDKEVHVTPMGVMFAYSDKTQVTLQTESGENTGGGYAPQLRIDTKAADKESYLWLSTLGTGVATRKGKIYICATYLGKYRASETMAVQLYSDDNFTLHEATITVDEGTGLTKTDEGEYLLTVEDANATLSGAGFAIHAKLLDQYGELPFDSNGNEILPNVEITAVSGEAAGQTVALTTRLDADNNVYYLIYKAEGGKVFSANDLRNGTYQIRVYYQGVDDVTVKLKVQKEPNKFSYMKTVLNLSTESKDIPNVSGLQYGQEETTDATGEITTLRLTVPQKSVDTSGASSNQVVKVSFDPSELANQWRDTEKDQTASDFDVLDNLRDTNGKIDRNKVLNYFDLDYSWTGSSGNKVDITGVDFSGLGSGYFTYTSAAGAGTHRETASGAGDAVEGDPVYITVKATHKGEVKTNRFRIYFVRENKQLTTIKGSYKSSTAGNTVTVNMNVPEAGNKAEEAQLTFLAYDQYEDIMDWNALTSSSSNKLTMAVDTSTIKDKNGNKLTSLPAGVTLGGTNNATITVTDKAVACSFEVYASFGAKKTNDASSNNGLAQKITVKIDKAASRPTEITYITDDTIELDVPVKNGTAVSGGPKITVVDQYGEVMKSDEFFMTWSFNTAISDDKVSLNAATGEVTVQPCAQAWSDIVMSVKLYQKNSDGSKGAWMMNIKGRTTYSKLKIVRKTNPEVSELEITTTSVDYPLAADENTAIQLGAEAETEYGDKGALTSSDNATWILSGVKYQDGTSVKWREPVMENGSQKVDEDGAKQWKFTGEIGLNSSGEFTDTTRGVILLNRSTGELSFKNGLTDFSQAPATVTVICTYGAKEVEETITIKYDGNAIANISRIPTKVEFLDSLREEIEVPDMNAATKEVALDAKVLDQFGFLMRSGSNNVPCTWAVTSTDPAESKNAVHISTQNGVSKLVVGYQAKAGSVTLRATYSVGGNSASGELTIGLGTQIGTPLNLVPLGIEELGGNDMEAVEIPLPGFTGPAVTTAQSATYTLKSKVLDTYGTHLTSRTVTWEVVTDTYGLAKITNDNKLVLKNTQAWIDAERPANVTITLKGYDADPKYSSIATETVNLTLVKAADYGAYAMPELKAKTDDANNDWPVYTDDTSLQSNKYLKIPSIEDYQEKGVYKAYFEAEVYSQYGEKLPNWKAMLDIRNADTLDTTVKGLTMKADPDTRSGWLEISTDVDILLSKILVVAKPEGENATLVESVNSTEVFFHGGASYLAGVVFGDSYYNQVGNRTLELPAWQPGTDVNQPDGKTYYRYELNALVHDQRGADMNSVFASAYPVWTLDENTPDGITLENPTDDHSVDNTVDADDNVYGKKISLWVSSDALAQNETSKAISITVKVNGKSGGDFEKTKTLTFTKGQSGAQYMYFSKNDVLSTDPTSGVGIGNSIARPTADEESNSTVVSAVVYDTYGLTCSDVATSILFNAESVPTGVTIEAETDKDENVTGQKLVRDNKTLAELTTLADGSSKVTVTTACDLEYIELELTSGEVSGRKLLRLPITQKAKTASKLVLVDRTEGVELTSDQVELIINQAGEEFLTNQYYAKILDQYGEVLSSQNAADLSVTWTVKMPGENEGEWVTYEEYDEDNNLLPGDERFLQYSESNETRTLTLSVTPSRYEKEVEVQISCILKKISGELVQNIPIQSFELTLRRRASNSSSSAVGAYMVTYQAGEHGKLLGNITSEVVLEGTAPKMTPDVLADEGYGHRGWLLNGKPVSDVSALQVSGDITLVARYITLSDYAFVSGYEDGTVRPQNSVTRGEFIRMLIGATTNYDPSKGEYANPFPDVEDDKYYRDYVAYAYFYRITTGYADGTFRPEEPITRAEAAGMIAKAMSIEPVENVKVFTDLSAESWYTKFAEALGRAGILSGYEDGTFRPDNKLTRAEAMTMLVKISDGAPTQQELNALRKNAEETYSDLKRDYWAFPYIARASGVA